jgi:hypothetical protein
VLKHNGSMLIQENGLAGDNTGLFRDMIEESGGSFVDKVISNPLTPESPMYYIFSKFN